MLLQYTDCMYTYIKKEKRNLGSRLGVTTQARCAMSTSSMDGDEIVQYVVSNPEVAAQFSGLTLDGLRRRPAELQAKQHGLEAQLRELASGPGCAGFVESARCISEVHAQMRALADHLAKLQASLPRISAAADSLLSTAQESIARRERYALLQEHQAELAGLLEQPQLMESCVRNGLADEALELFAAAKTRALVHPDVPLLGSLVEEMSGSIGELRKQLLTELAGPLQLPEALRSVGILRRLPSPHALSERTLQICFLRNRALHIASAEAAVQRDDPVQFLVRYLDLCRIHWHETVTHARALFAHALTPALGADAADASAGGHVAGVACCPAGVSAGTPLVARVDGGVGVLVEAPPHARAGAQFEPRPSGAQNGGWRRGWGAPVGGEARQVESEAREQLVAGELVSGSELTAALLASWANERLDELLSTLEARHHTHAHTHARAQTPDHTQAGT